MAGRAVPNSSGGYRPVDPSPRFEAKYQQWDQTRQALEAQDHETQLNTTLHRRENLMVSEKEKTRRRQEQEETGRQLHRQNMRTRHERELADAQAKEKLQAEEEQRLLALTEHSQATMADELDRFEERLTRMGLDAKSKRAQDTGAEEGGDAIRRMIAAQSEVPFRHVEKLAAMTEKALVDTKAESEQYIKRMQQRKVEDAEARKEREKRRRKMLLDQQKNFRSVEERRRQDLLLQRLAGISRQERAMAQELCEQAQWKDVLARNRLAREEEYAKRRRQDAEEELERQRVLAERERQEYRRRTEAEGRRFQALWEEKQQRKQAKHHAICREVVGSLLDLVDHVVEHSAQTGEKRKALPGCTLVPKPLWLSWVAAFVAGRPVEPPAPAPPAVVADRPEGGPALSPQQAEEAEVHQLLSDAELQDYLLVRNAWGPAEGVACSATPTAAAAAAAAAGAGLFNAPLVALMERLQRVLHPPPPPAAPPLTDRVKAVVLGKPLSGKTTVAVECAKALNLAYLSPTALVEEATRQFNAEQDRLADSLPPSQRALYAEFLSLGRQMRATLLEGRALEESAIVRLLANRLRFLEAEGAHRGFVLDGMPATEAGFRELEKHLSGYDETQFVIVPPKLLLPHAPLTTVPPGAPPPSPPEPEPAAPIAELPVTSPLVPPDGGRKGTRRKSVSTKPSRSSVKSDAADLPETLPVSELVSLPLRTFPPGDRSCLDLVVHLVVPNPAVFARFAGQRQDHDGKLYHLEYDPPPLDRMPALQPVDRPGTSDAALLQEKVLGYTHEVKRVQRWLRRYGVAHDVAADRSPAEVRAAVLALLRQAVEDKAEMYRGTVMAAKVPPEPRAEAEPSEAPAASPRAQEGRLNPELAALFVAQWDNVEVLFRKGTGHVFAALRGLQRATAEHFVTARERFARFLAQPDSKQSEVAAFQVEFNRVERVLRSDLDTKAELHLRTEQLQDTLWQLTDQRREAGRQELQAFRDDEWLPLHAQAVRRQFLQLMQLEMDRFLQTRAFIVDYFHSLCGLDTPEDAGPLELDLVPKPPSSEGTKKGARKPDKKDEKVKDPKKDPKGGVKASDAAAKKPKPAEEPQEEEDPLAVAYNVALGFIHAPDVSKAEEEEEKGKKLKAMRKAGSHDDERLSRQSPEGMREMCDAEGELCLLRLGHLREKCAECLAEVERQNGATQRILERWLARRLQDEMQSGAALIRAIRESIEQETPLHYELRLEGPEFVVDEDVQLLSPHPPPAKAVRPPPGGAPEERLLVCRWLTKQQSVKLIEKFRQMAPSGRLAQDGFTRLFLYIAAVTHGQEDVPPGWGRLQRAHLDRAFEGFDLLRRGAIDWREFMLSALLWSSPRLPGAAEDAANPFRLPCPSLAELVALRDAFAPVVGWDLTRYSDQNVTREQFLATPFWFEPVLGEPRGSQLKEVLWELFRFPITPAGQPPVAHVPTTLLFLCTDPQVVRGVQKAFAVLAGPDGRLSSKLLHELLHFNASTAGEMDDRDEFSQDTIEAIFEDIGRSAGAGQAGERPVSFTEVCNTHLGRVMLNQAKMFLKKEVRFV